MVSSLVFWSLLSTVLASPLQKRLLPLPPSLDAFYTPDAGWDEGAPGTILRSRQIQPSIGDPDLQAWQLLYVSTQSNGTKMATVTTIFKPANARTDSIIAYST